MPNLPDSVLSILDGIGNWETGNQVRILLEKELHQMKERASPVAPSKPLDDHNLLLLTDSYKATHYRQYPPNTTTVYSYFESRGGKWDSICFFGLQYIMKRYLQGKVVTREKIEEAARVCSTHFGDPTMFNRSGWEYILEHHDGHLPVTVKAVPEGQIVPVSNVLVTIENTDPACFWLPNYLETLLVQLWYPCTVATSSREQKKIIAHWLAQTGSNLASLPFKLHDFGFRGVSSVESAGIGGLAHLVNFKGTDTMAALTVAERYYGESAAGFSIPASEHSTITSWGINQEVEAFKNMLEKYPTGVVACVSDSWNIFEACEKWATDLREAIESRDGTLVVRPDSGDPVETVCKVLDILESGRNPKDGGKPNRGFQTSKTSTGHKLLPKCIRVIQGDGIDLECMDLILKTMAARGWAAENVAFGSGGGLLQKVNRDTCQFAFKCSFAVVNKLGREVFKDPATDPGKRSKKGRLVLVSDTGSLKTVNSPNFPDSAVYSADILVEVFRNGKILKEWTLSEIRERAKL